MGKSLISQEIAAAKELLDIGQAAAFLNVSEASLRRWTNSGRLPCLRVGQRRERRFRRQDLLGFLEGHPSGTNVLAGADSPFVKKGEDTSVTITHGSHLCGVYSSDLGRITLAVPFLLEGLEEGSVCFLVAPPRAGTDILKHLKRKRPALQSDIDAERLVISAYHAMPQAQCKYFCALIDRKASGGAQSFRVFGDVWGMRSQATEESVIDSEALYDQLIARRYPVVTLCAYDARKFSGVEVLSALKGHRDTFRYPLERALA